MPDSTLELNSDPAEVVRRFIINMHEWEMRILSEYEAAAKSEQYDAFWTDARRSLEDVFSRWCTPKERRHGRLGSFANPPEYQPSHEQILETVNETPRRIIVLTRRIIGFKDARKYVLL
jgi:hypothetical protein